MHNILKTVNQIILAHLPTLCGVKHYLRPYKTLHIGCRTRDFVRTKRIMHIHQNDLILWEIDEVLRCNSPPRDGNNGKSQTTETSSNQIQGVQNNLTTNIPIQNKSQQNGQIENFTIHHTNQNQQLTPQQKLTTNQQMPQNSRYKGQALHQVLQGNKVHQQRSIQSGDQEIKKMINRNASQNIQMQQQQTSRSPQSSQQNLLRDCQVQQQHGNVNQTHMVTNPSQQHIIVQPINSPLQQGTIAVQIANPSNSQMVGSTFPTESIRQVTQISSGPKNMMPSTSRSINSNEQSYMNTMNNTSQISTNSSGNNRQSGQGSNIMNQQRQTSVTKNSQNNNHMFEQRQMQYQQQVQSSLSRPQSQSQIVNSPTSVSTPQSAPKYVESPTYSNPSSNSQNNVSPKVQQRHNVNGQFLTQSQLQQLASQGNSTVVVLPSNGQNIARYHDDTRVVTQSQFISPPTRAVGAIIQNNVQQTRFVPQFQNANIIQTTSNGDIRQEMFQTGNINAKSQQIIIDQNGSRIVQHVVLGTPQINQNMRTSNVPTSVSIQNQPISHITSIQQQNVTPIAVHTQKHISTSQIQQNQMPQQVQQQSGQSMVHNNTSQQQQQIQHVQVSKPQQIHHPNVINVQQSSGNKKSRTPVPKATLVSTNVTTNKKKNASNTNTPNTSFNTSTPTSSSTNKTSTTPMTSTPQTPTANESMLQANQMAVRLSIENLHQISQISDEIEKLKQLQAKTGQNHSAKIKSLEDKRGLIFISALQQQHNVTTQIQPQSTKTPVPIQPKQVANGQKNKSSNKRNPRASNNNSINTLTPKSTGSSNTTSTSKQGGNQQQSLNKDSNKSAPKNIDKKSSKSAINELNDSHPNHSISSQSTEQTKHEDSSKNISKQTSNKVDSQEVSKDGTRSDSIDDNGDENSKDSCTSPEEKKIVIPTSTIQSTRIFNQTSYRKRNIELFKMEMIRRINNPDVSTPFTSKKDVVNRLIPYSIFQEPELKNETLERFDHDYLRFRNSQTCRIQKFEAKLRSKMMKEAESPSQFKIDHLQFLMMDVEFEKRRLKKEKEKANTDEVKKFIDRRLAERGNDIDAMNELKKFVKTKQENIPHPHKLHFSYDLPEVDYNDYIPKVTETWKTPNYTVYDSSEEEEIEEKESEHESEYESGTEHSENESESNVSSAGKESIENIQQESSLIFIKSSLPFANPLTSNNVIKNITPIPIEQPIVVKNNNVLTEKIENNEQTSIAAMLQKLEGLDNTGNKNIIKPPQMEIKEEQHVSKISLRFPKSGLINGDLSSNLKYQKTMHPFSAESLLNANNEKPLDISNHSLKIKKSTLSQVPSTSLVNQYTTNHSNNTSLTNITSTNETSNPSKCVLKLQKINGEIKLKTEEDENEKDKRRQAKRERKEKKKAKKLEKQRLKNLEEACEVKEVVINESKSISPTPRLLLKLNRNSSSIEPPPIIERINDKDTGNANKVVPPIKIDKKHKEDKKNKNILNSFKLPKESKDSIEKIKIQQHDGNSNIAFISKDIEKDTSDNNKKRKSESISEVPLKIPKLKIGKHTLVEPIQRISEEKVPSLSIPKLKIHLNPSTNSNEGDNNKIQKISISRKSITTLVSGTEINTSMISENNISLNESIDNLSKNNMNESRKREKKHKKDKEHKKHKHRDEKPLKLSIKPPVEYNLGTSNDQVVGNEKIKISLNLNKTWSNEETSTFSRENSIQSDKGGIGRLSIQAEALKFKNSDLVLKLPKIKRETNYEEEVESREEISEKIKPIKLSLKSLKDKQTDVHDNIPPLKIKKRNDKNISREHKEHKKVKDKKKSQNSYPVRPLHGTNPVLPPQERLASAYAEAERRSMIGKAPTLMNFS
uniref:GLTSCR1 domain-containing protein n=1 Tax=Parastrongyloides trichosuri TaxID=131310 RepID=A0A0N5A439_PARTI